MEIPREKYGDVYDIASQFSLQIPKSAEQAAELGFDKIVIGDPFDLNDINRSIPIFKAAIGGRKDNTFFYLVWDRLDESLYMRVVKTPAEGVKYDYRNEVEILNHRIYPSLVDGSPTVAAQVAALKSGFSKSELPDGAQMTYDILSLTQSQLNFDQKIFASSLEHPDEVNILTLPVGYILELGNLVDGLGGSGYVDGGIYDVSNGSGTGAQVKVSATPVEVTGLELQAGGGGFIATLYDAVNTSNGYGSPGLGTGLQILVESVGERGDIRNFSISGKGSGYSVGDVVSISSGRESAYFVVTEISGGEVTSATVAKFGGTVKSAIDRYGQPTKEVGVVNGNPLSGGQGYLPGNVVVIEGGSGDVEIPVVSVVTANNDGVNARKIDSFSFDNQRAEVLTVSHFSEPLEHGTSYKIIVRDVLNLAKQNITLEAIATTSPAPVACPPITSLIFEAYGSGEQTLTPLTEASYNNSHTNNQFIYFQAGLSWADFLTRFTGATPSIVVPESVTAPTTVYAWYKSGSYLLGEATWIVGLIGDELDYNQDYQYVLCALDPVLNYLQLTTVGFSSYVCGTQDWGGDFGGSIQQFAINR